MPRGLSIERYPTSPGLQLGDDATAGEDVIVYARATSRPTAIKHVYCGCTIPEMILAIS